MDRKLRTLNKHELAVLNEALLRLASSNASNAWTAKIMLDEKMPENFLWYSESA